MKHCSWIHSCIKIIPFSWSLDDHTVSKSNLLKAFAVFIFVSTHADVAHSLVHLLWARGKHVCSKFLWDIYELKYIAIIPAYFPPSSSSSHVITPYTHKSPCKRHWRSSWGTPIKWMVLQVRDWRRIPTWNAKCLFLSIDTAWSVDLLQQFVFGLSELTTWLTTLPIEFGGE